MIPAPQPQPASRALDPAVRSEALQKIADYFRPQLVAQANAEKLSAWAARNFYIPETDRPIQLLPHQEAILNYAFDQNHPYQYGGTIVYSTIKKCLALDTPVPTITGWTTMGNITIGTYVFDEMGLPCVVQDVSPIYENRACYKVLFSDGTSIVADANHLWRVQSLPKYVESLQTTEQLSNSLYRESDGAHNHRIPVASPLQLPTAELPIAPYTLGVWLADGNTNAGRIMKNGDVHVLERVAASHTLIKGRTHEGKAQQWGVSGLQTELRAIGLLGEKRIPIRYLRASYEQRLSLLQGLMDCDGYISKPRGPSGCECELSQKSVELAGDALELITTLGMKPTLTIDRAVLYGKDCGVRHRIKFHAPPNIPVFSLPRKLERQRPDETYTMGTRRSSNRHIINIEPVDSVPVRCIEVNSASHLFLAGYGMVSTHNSGKTALAAMVGRWIAQTWGRSNEVYAIANDQEQARGRIYQKIIDSIQMQAKNEAPEAKTLNIGWKIIERQAEYTPNGSIVRALSSDYRGEAGSNPTATLWTELWGYTSEASRRLWEELTQVPTRRRSVRYVETYAGYEDESDVLISLYNLGLEGRQLTHDDIDWPYPDRPPIWINERANVFMYWDTGVAARRMAWQTDAYYANQAATLRPDAFDRLHNNMWTTSTSSFIPLEWWARCRTPMPPIGPNETVVLGVDASVSSDCTAVVAVTRNPDPAHTREPQIRTYKVWYPPKGGVVNLQEVEDYLRAFCATYNVVEICYDAYQLHKLMTDLRDDAVAWCKPFSQSAQREISDKQLYDLIRDRRITHNVGPEFDDHILHAAAKTNPKEDTRMRIVKKASHMKIDLVIATSMAVYECLRLLLE